MQVLEHEMGGRLLERTSFGVRPTDAGYELAARMRPILAGYDAAAAQVRRLAQGYRSLIRVGYLVSVVEDRLNPALATLRHAHPEVKVQLRALFPSEQITALRNGQIDVALIGQEGRVLAREFYAKKLATLSALAAIPADHCLTSRKQIHLLDLRHERFVGAPENLLPGRNHWIIQLCQRAGFRPNLTQDGKSVSHMLSLIVSDPMVTIVPSYLRSFPAPGVALVPIADPQATWDFFVVWQRGRTANAIKAFSLGGGAWFARFWIECKIPVTDNSNTHPV
jgi:DNA-binding transcriptional LysR family regulator